MTKKAFRPEKGASASARYPTTDEAHRRRDFLLELAAVLNLPLLAGVLQACGDGGREAVPGTTPDGGVSADAKHPPDGTANPDQRQTQHPDLGLAPQPDFTGGIPDLPQAPSDQWVPHVADGLPYQPDLPRVKPDRWPPPYADGGLPPMPDMARPRPDAGKK
jgi:hypothetical protein